MHIITMTLLLFLSVTTAQASVLYVSWDPYQPTVPVYKFVLHRNENGGMFRSVAEIYTLTQTTHTDNSVRHNRTYCYKLAAVTAGGTSSPFSAPVCRRPLK